MQILDAVDAASLRSDIPDFAPGDTVKVHVNITEGNRSRIQVFQGAVIGRSGDGVRETFTVRKISFQVGVERTFPVHSPVIDHIEVVTRGDVRRASCTTCATCVARRPRSRRSATAESVSRTPRHPPGRSSFRSGFPGAWGAAACVAAPRMWDA